MSRRGGRRGRGVIALAALAALAGCQKVPDGPRPLQIEPSSGSNAAQTPVTIRGDGFYVVAHANYDDPERAVLDRTFAARLGPHPLAAVTWKGPRELAAVVPAGLPRATYDLVVTDPRGREGTLPRAFTVTGAIGDLGPLDGPRLDTLATDASRLDAAADRSGADRSDLAGLDVAKPDGTQPDGIQPDVAKPDGTQPDGAKTDAPTPLVPGTWVAITAGTFLMGAPTTDPCFLSNEDPQHAVTLTHNFEISAAETTQGEFQSVMTYNPALFPACGATCPVENVSWDEAAAYCNALSAKKGLGACYTCTGNGSNVSCAVASAYASGSGLYTCPGYRLATEAEWEYAYRAGTTTTFYNGAADPAACAGCTPLDANADAIGWFECNGSGQPHPVKQKKANAWGLFDMAGNVTEWCNDWYGAYAAGAVIDPVGPANGPKGVSRGGSWWNYSRMIRAAARLSRNRTGDKYTGFRCVRSLN